MKVISKPGWNSNHSWRLQGFCWLREVVISAVIITCFGEVMLLYMLLFSDPSKHYGNGPVWANNGPVKALLTYYRYVCWDVVMSPKSNAYSVFALQARLESFVFALLHIETICRIQNMACGKKHCFHVKTLAKLLCTRAVVSLMFGPPSSSNHLF